MISQANGSKSISVSTDGINVVPAHFSPPIDLNKSKFTLLDSSANALFVDVAVSASTIKSVAIFTYLEGLSMGIHRQPSFSKSSPPLIFNPLGLLILFGLGISQAFCWPTCLIPCLVCPKEWWPNFPGIMVQHGPSWRIPTLNPPFIFILKVFMPYLKLPISLLEWAVSAPAFFRI